MGADTSQQPDRQRERARRDDGARGNSGRGSASALDALRKQERAKERLRPRTDGQRG